MKQAALITIHRGWMYLGTCTIGSDWKPYCKTYRTATKHSLRLFGELSQAVHKSGNDLFVERIGDHTSWFPPTLKA